MRARISGKAVEVRWGQLSLTGYVNKQNSCYWVEDNLNEAHECPWCASKGTLWWAVSLHGFIRLYFYDNEHRSTMTVTGSLCWCCNLSLHLQWTLFYSAMKLNFNRMAWHRTLRGNQYCAINCARIALSPRHLTVTFRGPEDYRICPFVVFSCGTTWRVGFARLNQKHWMNWNQEFKTKFLANQLRCCSDNEKPQQQTGRMHTRSGTPSARRNF